MATSAAVRQAAAYFGRSLPRRAVLTIPSSDWKKLTKLPTFTNTDCVVLDLEDGVAESAKQLARDNILRYLNESVNTLNREICVRINAASSSHVHEDLKLIKALPTSIDCLFVPKVDSVDEVKWLADQLGVSVQFHCQIRKRTPSTPSIYLAQSPVQSRHLLRERSQSCRSPVDSQLGVQFILAARRGFRFG